MSWPSIVPAKPAAAVDPVCARGELAAQRDQHGVAQVDHGAMHEGGGVEHADLGGRQRSDPGVDGDADRTAGVTVTGTVAVIAPPAR